MASHVVQFRVPEEMIRFFKERQINANEAAREAFEGLYRKTKASENHRALSRLIRENGIHLTKSPAEIIREERDSH